jgi:hypothetical protein
MQNFELQTSAVKTRLKHVFKVTDSVCTPLDGRYALTVIISQGTHNVNTVGTDVRCQT